MPENEFIYNNLTVQKEKFINAEVTNTEITNIKITIIEASNVDLNSESNDISNAVNHVFMIPDLRP